MTDPFALVGTILERKYRVDEVVAEGGFGVVYRGLHLGLDTPVAIKVLRRSSDVDPDDWVDAMAQFQEEAKAIAKLRHPAVVRVMDAGVTPAGDVPWMVLEWLSGETLEAHLEKRRGQGRERAEVLALLRPVIEAIGEAHALGISHRDIKPSNVMLAPGARILDFGIAKLFGQREDAEARAPSGETTTGASVRAFSAVSAAPEQLAGTRTGPWTDVYALGLLVTEVLCDRAPYPVGDPAGRYEAAFDTQVRPTPAKLGVDAGPWEPVLARALAVRPSDRQPDATAFLRELERAGVQAISMPPTTGRAPVVVPARSRRWTAWTLGGGAIVLGAALFGVVTKRAKPAASTALSVDAAPACTGHLTCGKGAVCAHGACVALASEDCSVLADEGALASDDTLWIGSMFPMTGGDAAEYGLGNVHAVDLARRDFASIMGGTARQKSGDAARPFGVVACDDAAFPDRAAAHLATLGVPAVIGFRNGVEAMDLASSLFVPKGIVSLVATSTNPLVTRVPQPAGAPRLVWRTTYDADGAAGAIAAFVGASPKVALVRSKNAMGAALADAVTRELAQVRAAERAPRRAAEDPMRDFAFDADAPNAAAQYATVASEVLAFAPDVVVFAGGKPAVEGVLVPVERASKTKPTYVSVAVIGSNLLDFVGRDRALGRRVFGVTPVSNGVANQRFVTHYNETFPGERVTRTNAPNTAYDAFYLVAYASYAIGAGEIGGSLLAGAFAKLGSSRASGSRLRTVEVGLTGIFDAYADLSSGGAIDLVGATGSLDFDLTTGDAPFDQAILCVAYDASGKAIDGFESGLVYVANDRRMTGASSCK